MHPFKQGHLVVEVVAGGVVQLAADLDLQYFNALAIDLDVAFEDLVTRDTGVAIDQLVLDLLAQRGQRRLLRDLGERHLAHPIRASVDA
ncbi:hypothetical protein D3C76_1598370 [compost metagenome]